MLDFQRRQAEFAAHIRNPEKNPKPEGVEVRRMAIYNELFFNNVESFIASAFPVFKSLFTEVQWQELIRNFLENHQCKTPYFLEISEEFLSYIDDESLVLHQRFPFAKELCHYEWVELAIDVSDEAHSKNYDANIALADASVVISSLAWPLIYQWQVHQIGANAIPEQASAQPTCLIVYRSRNNKVEFLEANPLTLRLLEVLDKKPYPTARQALEQVAFELGHEDSTAIVNFGLDTLARLKALGIVLGGRL